ncbi:MAG: hypothetical protein V3U76_20045 [Granulosicoccus sp.]
MARTLSFTHDGTTFDASLVKVDRDQLYGSVRVMTKDTDGKSCTVATLASDGKTLIPRGGTALGYVNTEGEWISRSELQPVDLSGEPLSEVPSSFDAAIVLEEAVDASVLLDHNVRLSYRLDVDDSLPNTLKTALQAGKIFRFGFSYRGGISHDPAFILNDGDANMWMLVAEANDVQFVSLEQAAICAGESIKDEIDNDDNDNLDFGML